MKPGQTAAAGDTARTESVTRNVRAYMSVRGVSAGRIETGMLYFITSTIYTVSHTTGGKAPLESKDVQTAYNKYRAHIRLQADV